VSLVTVVQDAKLYFWVKTYAQKDVAEMVFAKLVNAFALQVLEEKIVPCLLEKFAQVEVTVTATVSAIMVHAFVILAGLVKLVIW
jgi:hypothetical protein